MKELKIYGERNTGTNYLSELINQNMDIKLLRGVVPGIGFLASNEMAKDFFFQVTEYSNLGWKHAIPNLCKIEKRLLSRDVFFLTLSKNPYSFLLSLYKKTYHYKGEKPTSFQEFIQNKWYVQKRDNHDGDYYETPVHLWNAKNEGYIKLKEKFPERTLISRYEDLIADPQGMLWNLSQFLQLPLLMDEFQNVVRSTKDQEKDYEFYKRYYLNEEWRVKLSQDDIYIINKFLDEDLLDYFGYSMIKLPAI